MKYKPIIYLGWMLFVICIITAVVIHSCQKNRPQSLISPASPATANAPLLKFPALPVTPLQENTPDSKDGSWSNHNAIAAQYDTRVKFWGKVVDQNNAPLEGVNITATVTTLRMIKTKNGYQEYEVLKAKSAADGSFMFDGSDGLYLDIEALGKEGYVLPSAYQFGMSCAIGSKYHYRYKSIGNLGKIFTPNSDRPEIFHLWKLNKPEPLEIAGNSSGNNGPEFTVNASIKRFRTIGMSVNAVGTPQAPQWEVTISTLEDDGGVVEADPSDIFMFEAPEAGYKPSITFRYGPEGADASMADPGAIIRFFVKSNSGHRYGASEYAFFAPNRDGIVETKMRSWKNPNSSRNLEHDGAKPLNIDLLK